MDYFFLRYFIFSLSIHYVRRTGLDETLVSVQITVEDFRIFFRRDLFNTHESIRSQLYIQIKCVRLRPSVSQEYRDWRWLKRIWRSRALIDYSEDQRRFTLRNFQYNRDVNRSEGTRSCEIEKLWNQYEWKDQWYWFSALTRQCRHLYRVRRASIRWRAFDCHAPYLLICPRLDQTDVVPMFSGNDVYTERKTYLNVNFTWSTDSILSMISLVWDLRSAVRFS